MMGNHDDSVRIVAGAGVAAVKLIADYAQGTLFSSSGDFRVRSIWRQRQNHVDLCLRPWIGDAGASRCRWWHCRHVCVSVRGLRARTSRNYIPQTFTTRTGAVLKIVTRFSGADAKFPCCHSSIVHEPTSWCLLATSKEAAGTFWPNSNKFVENPLDY